MNEWIATPLPLKRFRLQVFQDPAKLGPTWIGEQLQRHQPDWAVLWGDLWETTPGITLPEIQTESRRVRWLLWKRALLQEGVCATVLNSDQLEEPGASLLQQVPEAMLHRWGIWTEWRSPARPYLPLVLFWDGARNLELEAWLGGLGWPAMVVFQLDRWSGPLVRCQGRTLLVPLLAGTLCVDWDPETDAFWVQEEGP